MTFATIPHFVELTRNIRVIPEGENYHVIIQAETKLLVISEDDEHVLLERLDKSMRFWLNNNDPTTWEQMGKPFEPTEMFQINDVCFDNQMKEYVLISNGICALSHNSEDDEYKKAHEGLKDCVYKPYEAIAIRCVGTEVVEATDSRIPVCAWTYRGVNPDQLRKSDMSKEQFQRWLDACSGGRF